MSVGGKWHSVQAEYDAYGIFLQKGDNAMDASLSRCSMLLWQDPNHRYPAWHPLAGQKGSPRVFFFKSCERSIEEVSSWKFKEFRGYGLGLREAPVDVDDHLCDCFRYVAMSFPEPSVTKEQAVEQSAPEKQRVRKRECMKVLRTLASQSHDLPNQEVRDEEYI